MEPLKVFRSAADGTPARVPDGCAATARSFLLPEEVGEGAYPQQRMWRLGERRTHEAPVAVLIGVEHHAVAGAAEHGFHGLQAADDNVGGHLHRVSPLFDVDYQRQCKSARVCGKAGSVSGGAPSQSKRKLMRLTACRAQRARRNCFGKW